MPSRFSPRSASYIQRRSQPAHEMKCPSEAYGQAHADAAALLANQECRHDTHLVTDSKNSTKARLSRPTSMQNSVSGCYTFESSELAALPPTLLPKRHDNGEIRLEDGYQPHPFDVICKRDRERILHVGNTNFQQCVEARVDRYVSAGSRSEKTKIITEIIDAVQSSGGRFIRQVQDRLDANSSKGSDAKIFIDAVQSSGGTFIRQQQDRPLCGGDDAVEDGNGNMMQIYIDIGRKKAADKVGHAMRLAISHRQPATKRSLPSPIPDPKRRIKLSDLCKKVAANYSWQSGCSEGNHTPSEMIAAVDPYKKVDQIWNSMGFPLFPAEGNDKSGKLIVAEDERSCNSCNSMDWPVVDNFGTLLDDHKTWNSTDW